MELHQVAHCLNLASPVRPDEHEIFVVAAAVEDGAVVAALEAPRQSSAMGNQSEANADVDFIMLVPVARTHPTPTSP